MQNQLTLNSPTSLNLWFYTSWPYSWSDCIEALLSTNQALYQRNIESALRQVGEDQSLPVQHLEEDSTCLIGSCAQVEQMLLASLMSCFSRI